MKLHWEARMLEIQKYDVVILGCDISGLLIANALAEQGLSIAIINNKNSNNKANENNNIPFAISSKHLPLLQGLMNADDEGKLHYQKYENIIYHHRSIHDIIKEKVSQCIYDPIALKKNRTGVICNQQMLIKDIYLSLHAKSNLTYFDVATISNIVYGEYEAWITLDNHEQISTKLVIAADETKTSFLFQQHIPLVFDDDHRKRIYATIKTDLAHHNTIYQYQFEHETITLFPTSDPQISEVNWSLAESDTQQLLQSNAFNKKLTALTNGQLGLCKRIENNIKVNDINPDFYAKMLHHHRLILASNSAFKITKHNTDEISLLLADTILIINEIKALTEKNKDIGDLRNIRKLERMRKEQIFRFWVKNKYYTQAK